MCKTLIDSLKNHSGMNSSDKNKLTQKTVEQLNLLPNFRRRRATTTCFEVMVLKSGARF